MADPPHLIRLVPGLAPLLASAHHVDVKTVESEVDLRTFVAGMLSYYPWWMQVLYALRWLLVRALGMTQKGVPTWKPTHPPDVSMTPGEAAIFFTVELAEEERHWIVRATDRHLTARLGVVVESTPAGRRYHVLTLVHYHHWTGPLYFNVIRPFHHLVVAQMTRAGASCVVPPPDDIQPQTA